MSSYIYVKEMAFYFKQAFVPVEWGGGGTGYKMGPIGSKIGHLYTNPTTCLLACPKYMPMHISVYYMSNVNTPS